VTILSGLVSLLLTGAQSPLVVLDAFPRGTASPVAEIGVMFDRAVTANPDSVLRITPRLAGHAEWRDPVTLVFHPDEPMRADTRYVVVVSMPQLASPYTFTFDVVGPRLAWARPLTALAPDQEIQAIYSRDVDLDALARDAVIQFQSPCSQTEVALRAVAQRPVSPLDSLGVGRGWRRVGSEDSDERLQPLRRVVSLVPATCAAGGSRGRRR